MIGGGIRDAVMSKTSGAGHDIFVAAGTNSGSTVAMSTGDMHTVGLFINTAGGRLFNARERRRKKPAKINEDQY